MFPADKRRLAFISVLAIVLFFLVLTCIPTYLYVLFFFAVTCAVCYYRAEGSQLFERLGLNPRRGLTDPTALHRWLPATIFTGSPATGRDKRNKNKSDARNSLASPSDRSFTSGSVYRRDATFSDSLFSPRNILMGSYLGKAESSPSTGQPAGSAGSGVNPREHLRERLVRPNYGVPTPNRRLSFGDPIGGAGRFTITPQRHYPLQQLGTSPVGVLPPAQWDGFRKKNILTQRNTSVHSPVTVKIARPDNTTRTSFFDQLNSPGAVTSPGFEVQADPCSRETVLNVLRANRKRDVCDEEERTHEAGQKSKRRRNDSSESSQSVFEKLLANGAPSQLVPKPGSLKRGMNVSVLEESVVKRSRTSSLNSVSGCPISHGVPGSARNPIRSSYSSSQGYPQRGLASNLNSSPIVSPGSSQSQTPERVSKKPREDDSFSPNSDSAVNSDRTSTEAAPGSGKCSPRPDPPVTSQAASGGSISKRKRKIQLVSTYRGDHISLPPPPELGYTITVKDLDMEKKATLTQIQKVLQEPESEKPSSIPISSAPAAPSVGMLSQVVSFSSASAAPVGSATSLASLFTPAAGLPPASHAVSIPGPTPTIDLTVPPISTVSAVPIQAAVLPIPAISTTSATPVSNPLLESLKSMKNNSLLSVPSPVAATSAAPATSVAAQASSSITSTTLSFGAVKSEPSIVTPQSTVSTAPSSVASAFAQILAQPLPSSSVTLNLGGGPFVFTSSAPTACATIAPTVSVPPASSRSNPTPSEFKPIFGPAMMTPASTAADKPSQNTFKPIFGSAFNQPASSTVPAAQINTSLFGGVTSTQPVSCSVPLPVPNTQNSSQSLFGSQSNSHSVALSVSMSSTQNPSPALFGGLTNSQTMAVSVSSSSKNTQNSTPSLFGGLPNSQPMAASVLTSSSNAQNPAASLFQGLNSSSMTASTSSSTQNSSTPLFAGWNAAKSTFQFGGSLSTAASSGISTSTTTNSTNTTLQFGALKPAPTAPQNTFTFGQSPATTSFTGFGMPNNANPMTNTPSTQATFGSSAFSPSTCFANPQSQAPTPVKPFTFGASAGGGTAATPLAFGTPASTAAPTFGNSTQSAFGGTSTAFAFGNTSTVPVSAASMPAPAFKFGAAQAAQQNSTATSGGFNFTTPLSGAQFGTPTQTGQNQGFSFGAGNTDNESAFGTSTSGYGAASGPSPFGSPGTPVGGFGASAFGTPSATFSIGACSKPSGSRQRLQARRQHTRKK
ncbi:nuclear envelope pore membrane protein POM 121 isoform X1 [Silurus meridionalis]|uniref:nuclear envelope pore membrane protein POM 121 isoform X1 n=1 Tax=Silurus meridionalis TaxID=175797 RepID=UPI001EEA3D48|nr:nuclear envelope pore membrane protein POM 121 isoform X1 [Silurus meridionalis]